MGNKIDDSAAWRLNAMAETSDSFRNGVRLERYAVNPTVTLFPGAGNTLTLGYEHLHDERTADRGFPSQNGRPVQRRPEHLLRQRRPELRPLDVDGLYAVLDHDFGNGLHLKNSFRATHYDKFYQNVYPGSAVNAAGNLTLSAYNNANQRTNVFNQTDLTKKLSAGGIEHTLLAGLELGNQDSTNKRNTGFFGAGHRHHRAGQQPVRDRHALCRRTAPTPTTT